ncbi:MAG: DNA ligase [Gallionellales bacterium 35-53-114]|jgi:DNA ligase-1|nr:MAG: DNA ligase [Gallionellales bacterium 35-53-114]OYZ63770.1 MAG: DNA ligase [Gallionellales bacterium 24-53-125]OZB09398.1 MAG: DNA ligase [Gallionellales bacterium 39-52-133]HQS57947.1 DNA ligase [Gallionellaceae bacterium]HQS76108.1 DNA ligase [Gallionellaceae bacterium]
MTPDTLSFTIGNRVFALSLLILASLLLQPRITGASDFAAPPAMLARVYHSAVPLADYLVSEKLDGVRGYWDGEKLLTRGGEQIMAPAWFTAGWPKFPLDGELWVGRGQFAAAVSIVRKKTPDEAAWRTLRFMVFDLPAHPGNFAERNEALKSLLAGLALPWLRAVEQFRVADRAGLHLAFERVIRKGGEGLMLHRAASAYQAGRSDDLLKLKPYDDAEAKIVAHLPGKGKYQGMLGALLVETPEGLQFRIGTGFSAAQRRHPPALGSWITYRYIGLHEGSGIPRFASFMRVREDMGDVRK